MQTMELIVVHEKTVAALPSPLELCKSKIWQQKVVMKTAAVGKSSRKVWILIR